MVEKFRESGPEKDEPVKVEPGFDLEQSVEKEEPKTESPEAMEAEISELKKEIGESYKANPNEPERKEREENLDQDRYPVVEKEQGEGILKKMGIGVGRFLGSVVGSFENRVKKFEIKCSGEECLKKLDGQPYILAANHIKPKNILLRSIGLSSDSFVIRRVVKEESQRTPNAIANVTGKIRKIPIVGFIDNIWSSFREGLMEGAGFVPVKMKRGKESAGFNRNFVKKFRESIERGEPIIIFPQGRWDKDFNPKREFETGAATLARRYDLPVVPVYIHGGRSWSSKEKASVSFGQIIRPEGKTKEEITGEIKENIGHLHEESEEK